MKQNLFVRTMKKPGQRAGKPNRAEMKFAQPKENRFCLSTSQITPKASEIYCSRTVLISS